ncbi:MAG: DegQ family serine endoprotease [Alcanivoracaceae bacterium]|nr:DegQ family serine endoprotease [Alcanivoracaceae bacterium]
MRLPVLVVALLAMLSGCDQSASPDPRPVANAVGLPDFVSLVEENAPAVVNISTEQDPDASREEMREQLPEMFRELFEGMEDLFRAPPPQGQSLGSGFIISDDGFILSNYHVVANADRIIVRLQDRRELAAEIVGKDERSDLVLLKVEAEDLPTVSIGSSEALRVGEWVLAIGAPFGFDSSVTAGIVSAKGRSLPSENYVPFIQTDVAINPGNSGGPLFNLAGEVVGINSQIVSRSGGYMGLSFAIPIDMAMGVVQQLRDNGKVSRGWLGVMIQSVDRELAQSFGLQRPTGALVSQVLKDSPAEAAGVEAGDVIIRFAGEAINESSQLPQVVGILAPGSDAEMVLIREGEEISLDVTIGELPDDAEARFSTGVPRSQPLGLEVGSLSAEELNQLGLTQGVRVIKVDQGPAEEAGIRAGDVLVTLNGRPVDSPEVYAQVVASLPAQGSVPVLVNRDGNARFLALKLGAGD